MNVYINVHVYKAFLLPMFSAMGISLLQKIFVTENVLAIVIVLGTVKQFFPIPNFWELIGHDMPKGGRVRHLTGSTPNHDTVPHKTNRSTSVLTKIYFSFLVVLDCTARSRHREITPSVKQKLPLLDQKAQVTMTI